MHAFLARPGWNT